MIWDRQAVGGLTVVLVIAGYLAASSLADRIDEAESEAAYADEQAAAAEQRAQETENRIDDLESRLDDLESRSSYRY